MMFAPRYTVWHCGTLKKGRREMSNTPEWVPRYEESARPDHAECAKDYRELEKENAALREQLKDCSAAFDRQQEQLDRNAEQIAALRKDAERYQWLRTNRLTANNGILFAQAMGWKPKMLDAVGVDAAIDSAMKEEGK